MRRFIAMAAIVLVLAGCSAGSDANAGDSPATNDDSATPVPTLSAIAKVFEATDGGSCKLEDRVTSADLITKLSAPPDHFEPGTKGYVEDERASAVVLSAVQDLPADTIIHRHYCFRPGSDVYAVGPGDQAEVLIVKVCCKPSDDLVSDLRATGAMVDPSPLPDDGSVYEPVE